MNRTDGEFLVLSVRDDGVGLAPHTALGNGSTLGLKLVANLARQLKGELNVSASEGVGTALDVTFPVPSGTVLEKEA
jgi:two-component sensor histidine kinase